MRQRLAQFSVGAAGYSALEVLARGHTHWTMAVLGGICLCALCAIAHSFAHKSIVFQAALGTAFITAAEFATGLVVNRWLGWAVWDYTKEAGNLLGQVVPAVQLLLVLPVLRRVRGTAACAAPSGGQGEHLTVFSTLAKAGAPLGGPPSLY